MKPVVVVGSGASGVHFAWTLLERGRDVVMLDVGFQREPIPLPDRNLPQLKEELDDPIAYLLGRDFEAVTWPGDAGEYYGLPPGKAFVFQAPRGVRWKAKGFEPLHSFARGGLAEAWTAGVYPFSSEEISDYPIDHADLLDAYGVVARRIGISGELDDLARFMPAHDHLLSPLELDRHSRRLLDRYGNIRGRLNEGGVYVGRSRVAALSRPYDGREPCAYLGRCLWGCPRAALYTPSITLDSCLRHPSFRYVPGMVVDHFIARGQRVTHVVARGADGSGPHVIDADNLVLAAGTLSSARIFLESMRRASGEVLRLTGLMDNRQVLVPFVNLDMIGVPYEPASYQYHLLGIGLEEAVPSEYVHCQLTTLKTGMAHPVLQSLPMHLRGAVRVFRELRSALGIVNVNFHDRRRDSNAVTLDVSENGEASLVIDYAPEPNESKRLDAAIVRLRRALRQLHCIVPPGMVHVRPMGASVHYAGTLPMRRSGGSLTTTPECRSRDFENLWFADGSTFPFLPAKNITFTLMANAVRIARQAF